MNWSKSYTNLVNRNIGIVSLEEQEILRCSCVCVFGVGGLGGVIAEVLIRSGIGNIKIIDKDKFDPTNLNRQNFSQQSTLGVMKIDAVEEGLKGINPELKVEKYDHVNEENIGEILSGCNVACLALDETKPCIIISREAKKKKIPAVEGWALPYGNVRVFTPESPSLEEIYNLPTTGKDLSAFSEQDFKDLDAKVLIQLSKIKNTEKFYSPEAMQKMKTREWPLRSFAPCVWLTAVLMANETIKITLKKGGISIAPNMFLVDTSNSEQ